MRKRERQTGSPKRLKPLTKGQYRAGQHTNKPSFDAGYHAGYKDCFEEMQLLSQAITQLEIVGNTVTNYATMTAWADQRMLDTLREKCTLLAGVLSAALTELIAVMKTVNTAPGRDVVRDISNGLDALTDFTARKDDGEKLRRWAAGRGKLTDSIMSALADMQLGGRPVSDARHWLGRAIHEARELPDVRTTYREATIQVYRRLIQNEDRLSPVERDVLAELDRRNGNSVRVHGMDWLSEAAVSYARGAARDWKKRRNRAVTST